MKKIIGIMLLGIILIGTGAKSKLNTQFPYQLNMEDGREAAVQALAVSSQEEMLDELAEDMGAYFAWSEEKTDTGSSIVTVDGAAGVDFQGRYSAFELSFRVLPDGKMRVEDVSLHGKSASFDSVLQTLEAAAAQAQKIKRLQTPKVMIRGE